MLVPEHMYLFHIYALNTKKKRQKKQLDTCELYFQIALHCQVSASNEKTILNNNSQCS